MQAHLRDSCDFQRVYKTGKRYDGKLITAFALPNKHTYHRLGITASRKALGNAVERNRAKRLLRETFRLTKTALDGLQRKYDWVLNGRRALQSARISQPLGEFQKIVNSVASEETIDCLNEQQLA